MEIFIAFIMSLFLSWFGGGVDQSFETAKVNDSRKTAEVVRVIDGDTIEVLIDDQLETVRYIGIDTPEPYRDAEPACFSVEASDFNQSLVAGKTVTLVSDTENRDRYERLLRYVYVDEVFINEQLVAQGYATTMTIEPNTKHAAVLNLAKETAKTNNLGLWSACADGQSATVQPELSNETGGLGESKSYEIDTSELSSNQKRILAVLGIDASVVTVTEAMMTCAEGVVDTTRLEEIMAGDMPSILEGIRLANCYRTN